MVQFGIMYCKNRIQQEMEIMNKKLKIKLSYKKKESVPLILKGKKNLNELKIKYRSNKTKNYFESQKIYLGKTRKILVKNHL
jgi:hypothetical protein